MNPVSGNRLHDECFGIMNQQIASDYEADIIEKIENTSELDEEILAFGILNNLQIPESNSSDIHNQEAFVTLSNPGNFISGRYGNIDEIPKELNITDFQDRFELEQAHKEGFGNCRENRQILMNKFELDRNEYNMPTRSSFPSKHMTVSSSGRATIDSQYGFDNVNVSQNWNSCKKPDFAKVSESLHDMTKNKIETASALPFLQKEANIQYNNAGSIDNPSSKTENNLRNNFEKSVNNFETKAPFSLNAATTDKGETSLEERQWHFVIRDKDISLGSFVSDKKHFGLNSLDVSRTLNFQEPESLLENWESRVDVTQLSQGDTVGAISSELTSRVNNGSGANFENVKENKNPGKYAIDVKEPSGIPSQFPDSTNKRKFKCDICSKQFPCGTALETHYRTHTGEKPFVCNVCNKGFVQKAPLIRHYRTHTGEKPFACDVCKKAFSTKGILDNHYRTHTSEKPFACDVCKKAFSTKGTLDYHYRSHTGEKPATCYMCNKGFSSKSNFSQHFRTHTGEKPFVCNVCNKGFTRRKTLCNHYRIHFGEKPIV